MRCEVVERRYRRVDPGCASHRARRDQCVMDSDDTQGGDQDREYQTDHGDDPRPHRHLGRRQRGGALLVLAGVSGRVARGVGDRRRAAARRCWGAHWTLLCSGWGACTTFAAVTSTASTRTPMSSVTRSLTSSRTCPHTCPRGCGQAIAISTWIRALSPATVAFALG